MSQIPHVTYLNTKKKKKKRSLFISNSNLTGLLCFCLPNWVSLPIKPKVFTTWPFAEKVCWHLRCSNNNDRNTWSKNNSHQSSNSLFDLHCQFQCAISSNPQSIYVNVGRGSGSHSEHMVMLNIRLLSPHVPINPGPIYSFWRKVCISSLFFSLGLYHTF